MVGFNSARAVGKRRQFMVCVLLALAIVFGVCGLTVGSHGAEAEETTQAYYLGMDTNTHGNWYDSSKASGSNYTYADCPRLYGNDGFMINYAKITGDGQPETNLSRLSDYTEDSPVHYAKWPSYVANMSGSIESVNDVPHGYWNYAEAGPQSGAHGTPGQVALLSPEPSVYSRKSVWQITRDYIYLQVDVNDDEWHKVSIYVGDDSGGAGGRNTWYQYVRIMDLDRNVISSITANAFDQGIYYSFAVKGSFIMNIQQIPGTIQAVYSAIFFDPLMPDDMNPDDYAKTNFTADLEGARTVNLSWTNTTPSKTTIYRKEKGEPDSAYELIATLANPNLTSYTDTDTRVATDYVYLIGSGIGDDDYANVTHYTIPSLTAEITTAPYWLTSVTFDQVSYESSDVTKEISVSVKVMRKVGLTPDTDEEGEGEQPYANKEIFFTLDGELAYDTSQTDTRENMNVELGSEITDENGVAKFEFTPEYAGTYTLIATSPLIATTPDEMQGYDEGVGTALLVIEIQPWSQPPVLSTISDAINPGDTVTVMGTGIDPTGDFQVAIAPNAGTVDPAFDANRQGLQYIDALITDATYQSGVMFTLPESFKAGLYDVWVTSDGENWSNGITLNAARPLYISQEAAYAGLELEIVGRNFFRDEFGMSESLRSDIRVKFVDVDDPNTSFRATPSFGVRYTAEESVTGVAIDESNPYRLTVVIPDSIPVGEYYIYVANDGANYRKLATTQTLEIVAKKQGDANASLFGAGSGYDPLGLGVYWAQNLNYSNVSRMTQASGADLNDDTADIQAKINDLYTRGGGIVYFPEGSYYVDYLDLKDGVMLIGEDKEKVTLYVRQDQSSQNYFIKNPGSNNGIARLTIELDLDNGSRIPDMYLNFADEPDSSSDVDTRVHYNVFIKDIVMDFPYDVRDPFHNSSNRGLGILISGLKNFIIDDNQISGFFAVLHRGFVNEYVSIRNNIFHIQRDVMHCMASYAFIENTALIGNNNDGHGWSARSDCYFGNNYIANVGPTGSTETGGAIGEDGKPVPQNNNGEVIMLEVPGAQINFGDVLGSTENTITVDRFAGSEMSTCDYNYFAVVITDGPGMGQVRYIERRAVQNTNPSEPGYMANADPKLLHGNTFKLRGDSTWDILPDQNSQYSIYVPIEHATIYRNTAEHCAKSILLYSQCHDALVAENTMNETEGISVYSTIQGSSGVKGTNFFVRVERNTVTGVSPASLKGGIGVMTERNTEGSKYMGLIAGGVSIRYNTLKDVPSAPEYGTQSETPETNGIYVHTDGQPNVVEDIGDIRFTVIEGNTVDTSAYGVYIDNRAYCTVIRNNVFTNIEQSDDIYNLGAGSMIVYSTITFDLQGGSFADGTTATKGEFMQNATLPTATKDDSYFWGWATTKDPADGTSPITTVPASNTTLYAVYGYAVNLVWNYEGMENEIFRTIVVLPNGTTGRLPNAYRTDANVSLTGWYVDAACTQLFDESTEITGNMTLYAGWSSSGIGGGGDPAPEPGCGGSFASGAILLCVGLTAAAAVLCFVRMRKSKGE